MHKIHIKSKEERKKEKTSREWYSKESIPKMKPQYTQFGNPAVFHAEDLKAIIEHKVKTEHLSYPEAMKKTMKEYDYLGYANKLIVFSNGNPDLWLDIPECKILDKKTLKTLESFKCIR